MHPSEFNRRSCVPAVVLCIEPAPELTPLLMAWSRHADFADASVTWVADADDAVDEYQSRCDPSGWPPDADDPSGDHPARPAVAAGCVCIWNHDAMFRSTIGGFRSTIGGFRPKIGAFRSTIGADSRLLAESIVDVSRRFQIDVETASLDPRHCVVAETLTPDSLETIARATKFLFAPRRAPGLVRSAAVHLIRGSIRRTTA